MTRKTEIEEQRPLIELLSGIVSMAAQECNVILTDGNKLLMIFKLYAEIIARMNKMTNEILPSSLFDNLKWPER